MPIALRLAAALVLFVCTSLAHAAFHMFRIDQVYSSADGRVQFVVLRECCNTNGESVWTGQALRSTGPDGANAKTFTFPKDLPSTETGQKFVLVATQGYAALGIVTPDFIMPDNFLPITGGTLSYAAVHQISFSSIPTDGASALSGTGDIVNNVATNFAGDFGSIVATPGTPSSAPSVEFYNASLDHYFITHVLAEIAILDAGLQTKGWVRTQQTFRVYTSPAAGTSPVCRFYIPPGKGDSHFYGRGTQECEATGRDNPTFVNEDPQFFHVMLPQAGNCAPPTVPLYRVFSNRNDANHRYMVDRAIRDQMTQRGWLAEGDGPDRVVMCVPGPDAALRAARPKARPAG
ncbi:MAG: hypothetical protein IT518_17555 [Burkholderiales bacterium]|nr:hypothetical protein [Burkholderiales bacterium]